MIYRISPLLSVIAAMWLAVLPATGQRATGDSWFSRQKNTNSLSDSISATAAHYSAALDSLILRRKVYSINTAEETLENLFSKFGQVISSTIIRDSATNLSKGFGFIEMEDDNAAKSAVASLSQREVDGRRIRVNFAEEKKRRTDSKKQEFTKF